jgi:4-hydroxy-3-polyprenylbenzoate decarboxylase
MALLEKDSELHRLEAEVNWEREICAIARRRLEKKGLALLFENIRGYQHGRCTKLLTGGLADSRRVALALGSLKDAPNRDLAQHVMLKNRETIAPVVVRTGPVKDHVLRGAEVAQTVFPVPK